MIQPPLSLAPGGVIYSQELGSIVKQEDAEIGMATQAEQLLVYEEEMKRFRG